MSYIVEIGSRLYFRRRVPEELQPILGIAEFKRALRTCRMEDAKAIAAHLNEKLEKVFVAVASGVSLDVVLPGLGLKLRKRSRTPGTAPLMASVLYRRYSEEMVATRQWSAKTENENRISFNMFLSLIGDRPVTEVTHSLLMEYRGMVQRLPPNSTKAKATRHTRLHDLLKVIHPKTLSITRVNHILVTQTGFYKWLHTHEIIPDNPAHDLLLPKVEPRPDEERQRYSVEEIRRIFAGVQEFRILQPERYWTPIIAAYSGMRVNEICQLYLDDLREIDGVWCFDLNESRDKRLKNSTSRRLVPVHPRLLTLGILDYARELRGQGHERLFPRLRRHRRNGYAHQVIAWFIRFNRHLVTSDRRKTLHSLRHSFIDTLKQLGVEPYQISEVVGHASGNMTMTVYGKKFHARVLLDAISRVAYEEPRCCQAAGALEEASGAGKPTR